MGFDPFFAVGLLCGAVAAALSQARTDTLRRWACVAGLAGQPFWLYGTWNLDQPALFACALLYLAAWLRGGWVHWWLPRRRANASPLGLGTIQITPGR